ncbi:hypothetical protein D3C76_1299550 [compost metagenome]
MVGVLRRRQERSDLRHGEKLGQGLVNSGHHIVRYGLAATSIDMGKKTGFSLDGALFQAKGQSAHPPLTQRILVEFADVVQALPGGSRGQLARP